MHRSAAAPALGCSRSGIDDAERRRIAAMLAFSHSSAATYCACAVKIVARLAVHRLRCRMPITINGTPSGTSITVRQVKAAPTMISKAITRCLAYGAASSCRAAYSTSGSLDPVAWSLRVTAWALVSAGPYGRLTMRASGICVVRPGSLR